MRPPAERRGEQKTGKERDRKTDKTLDRQIGLQERNEKMTDRRKVRTNSDKLIN